MMKTKNLGMTIGSILIILLLMPLGHALMIIMEHTLEPTALHYSAFAMGFVGLVITIWGVFVKGDTKQTVFGMTGALLFWTGWVEFLLAYYAQRYGVHCDLVGNGVVETATEYVNGIGVHHTSRPEYLIMPATFGMWMMFLVMYIFCTKTGCNFIRWIQNHCGVKDHVELRPMAHHASIVTFMEWNIMMWGLYLLLMFCYDPVFLGTTHPVTYAIGILCLIGSGMIFKKQLYIGHWGRNLRMSLANVIVLWSAVEIAARNGFFKEIWVDPGNHVVEMVGILLVFVGLILGFWFYNASDTKK